MSLKTASKHRLTPFLKVKKGILTYPVPKEDSTQQTVAKAKAQPKTELKTKAKQKK